VKVVPADLVSGGWTNGSEDGYREERHVPKSTATTSVFGSTAPAFAAVLAARFMGRTGGGAGLESYAAGPRLGSLPRFFCGVFDFGRNMLMATFEDCEEGWSMRLPGG
jgi:hypothetical protein